ncbi:MAG: metalloregulator ArsR/SmtB family transcription factor [Gemmatimonadetes bacterium]|nr:metalloregulator ArsR/SmtB family transcription factor [Gemmatimonadota bacterium]
MSTLTRPDTTLLLPILQALADENRLRILDALREGERCVCVLQERVGVSQSLLSHHLRVLRDAGVVTDRKEGRWVHYSLSQRALEELDCFLRDLREDAPSPGPGMDCRP